jgi:tetratricopeptide (TPR) repeat protein/predicted Ser/Thr protein kinase
MNTFSAGSLLLHFKILSKLGEGGMGAVYLAEDQKLGRKVALKVLPDAPAASEKARRRLLQEARSASALNHPNIVTIHSIEQHGDIDFIVMEFAEGETLSQKMSQGPLQVPKLLDFAIQIADGLAAAHSAGVIHRDIKSSNVLVTGQNKVKILDFGLAKITALTPEDMTGDAALTEEGSILGTLYYMSPEQVQGEALDARSDVFSLGALMYEAATGRLPFRGPNTSSVMYQILNAVVPPPSSYRDDLPRDLDTIILRALAKEKSLRYQNAQEIADDLRRLQFPRTEALSPIVIAVTEPVRENFVGREAEIEKLKKSSTSMLQGSGCVVFLVGEPGIGKSALAEHFLRLLNPHNVLIGRGRCVEHFGAGEAYLPFLDAVSSFLNGPAKQAFTTILRQFAPTWCTEFPAAFTSTGVLEKSQQEAASASKERMLREISDALNQLSAVSPVLLFLEDLHWADPSTADLLRYLSRKVKTQRMMILATMRAEDVDAGNPPMKACRLELQSHSLSLEIQMNSFSETQVQEYLDLYYSPSSFPREFSSMLFRKTEGQPLFLSGLLQFLVNNGSIEKKNDVWALTKSISDTDLDVPENVRSMIERKVDALNEDDKRVLQFASVEGEEFHSTILSDLLNEEEISLEERLDRIEKKHRLIASSGEKEWPDGSMPTSYRFVHALYQNAFYSSLVSKRRVQLHRMVGESLLEHFGEESTSIANKLGLHFMRGRDFANAAGYFELAGDQARTMFASAEAEVLYAQALSQLRELSKSDAKTDPNAWKLITAKLQEKHADVFSLLGNQADAKKELEAAARNTEEDDPVSRARIYRKAAKAAETQRDFTGAFELYQKAETLLNPKLGLQSQEWQREWLQVYLDRNWLYYTQNLQDKMQEESAVMKPMVESIGSPTQRFHFYRNLILAAFRRERYRVSDQTMKIVERAKEAAIESGAALAIAEIRFVLGFSSMWHGDLAQAEMNMQQALSESSRLEDAVLKSRCLTYLTVLYRKLGKEDLTRVFADKAFDHSKAINMQEYVAGAIGNRAWLALRSGQWDDVKILANEAITIWKSLAVSSPFQGIAIWPLIAAQLREGQNEEACKDAELLLDAAQRPQDPEVESLLREAIEGLKNGAMESAVRKLRAALAIVEPNGYL